MSRAGVLTAVAAGGGLGSAARHGLTTVWPGGGVEWATFTANTAGCALIGVLMVLVTEVRPGHPLLRPFLGTGVLGGFTTFSGYAVGVHRLFDAGRPVLAGTYLVTTVLGAVAATWLGVVLARRLTRRTR